MFLAFRGAGSTHAAFISKGKGRRAQASPGGKLKSGAAGRSQRFAAPILCGAGGAVFSFCPRPRGAERRQALARNVVPVARLAIGPVSLAKETTGR